MKNSEFDSLIIRLQGVIRERKRIEKSRATTVCTIKQWGGFLIEERTLLEIADDQKKHNLSEDKLRDRLRLYDKTIRWTETDQLRLESELLACPFCGASASDLALRTGRLENGFDIEESYAMCGPCGAIGPLCGSPELAVLYWNKRHVEEDNEKTSGVQRPCPFCGASNDAIVQRGPEDDCAIYCQKCLGQMDYDDEFDHHATALDKWNTRFDARSMAAATQLSLLDLMKLAK